MVIRQLKLISIIQNVIKWEEKLSSVLFLSNQSQSRFQFTTGIKNTLQILGIDSTNHKSHSFRIGLASDALLKEIRSEEIVTLEGGDRMHKGPIFRTNVIQQILV